MEKAIPDLTRNGLVAASIYTAIVAGAVLAALSAHNQSSPVTAALALMVGVILVASRAGLRAGLLAGVSVSALYNLFLIDPFLHFSFTSLDDLVPLLAFNLSAVAAAYVAGRLRDEARASATSESRVRSLLRLSQDLQTSVGLEAMLNAAVHADQDLQLVEVHLDDGRAFSLQAEPSLHGFAAKLRLAGSQTQQREDGQTILVDHFSSGTVVGVAAPERATGAAARLAVLAIAAERWALTEQLVSADVLRRSEEFKTTLLSSVSHDLRTPLAVISASASSLQQYGDDLSRESQKDLLDTIQQQSIRLNNLTGKLLDLGRVEGGISTSNMPEIDALEILGAALVDVRSLAPTRLITKSLLVEQAPVRADPSLLGQVIRNILENAVAHTSEDAPIHVSADSVGTELRIQVNDGGSGIAPSAADHIFERFYQCPGGAAQKTGTGLGLSIARGFARAMNGDVTLLAQPEGQHGSRFVITLPLIQEPRGNG